MNPKTDEFDPRSWLGAHQALWSLEEFLLLGRFHDCIDEADNKVEARISMREPADSDGLSGFERVVLTSFGREVGTDVPRWWVFSREPHVPELWDDTRLTFPAAQKLVRSAEKICCKPAVTYEHIIQELVAFLRRHRNEIEAVLAYANNLSKKHELAPAILFSYAVWGSTKRGDRSLENYPTRGEERYRLAGELALGIYERFGPTILKAWADLIDEAYEAGSEEYQPVLESTLLQTVQRRIRENVLTYFTELRDSLRHIDTLCQEFYQRENLFADDRFVRSLLKKISVQKSTVEVDLWDIKESLRMWTGPSSKKEEAIIDFVEGVAAFANNRGGILIIGITNRTREIVGVSEPETRIKGLETALRNFTDSDVNYVRIRALPLCEGGATRTCIIIVVGKADRAIGVRQKNSSYSYPLRIGSGMDRVSREQISAAKAHVKGVEFSFVSELAAWVADVT